MKLPINAKPITDKWRLLDLWVKKGLISIYDGDDDEIYVCMSFKKISKIVIDDKKVIFDGEKKEKSELE
jgi:hypothetical protein